MILFGGRLKRRAYLAHAAVRVALFAATVVGFPYILFAVGKVINCASVGGACGAVALVASTALKPMFFVAFVFSLIGICMRRARDAGLPAAVGLIIPGLVLADYQFGLFGGAHWSYAFSSGVLFMRPPWFLGCALIAIVLLGTLPSRTPKGPGPAVAGDGRAGETVASAQADRSEGGVAFPVWIILAGAIAAGWAVITSQPHGGVMLLIVQLMPIGGPTFVIYTAVIWAMWLIIKRRDAIAVAAFAASLVPFGLWAYAAAAVPAARQEEAKAIEAIKTERLERVPPVLVFQSDSVSGFFGLFGKQGITEVIADGSYSGKMMAYRGRRASSRGRDLTPVTELPPERLVLKAGRKSAFRERNKNYTADGGPFELRYVAPGRDDLIAVWYRTFMREPAFPPVLTMSGWLIKPNSNTTDEVTASLVRFFDRAVTQATATARSVGLRATHDQDDGKVP